MKYTKHLSASLRKRYTELQAEAIGSLSLRDETALYQAILTEAVEKHAKVADELASTTDLKQKAGLRALLDVCQSEIFYVGNQVRDMVLAASKLENDERSYNLSLVNGFTATILQEFDAILARMSFVTEVDVAEIRAQFMAGAKEKLLTVQSTINQGSIIDMASGMPADMEARMMDEATAPRRIA